MLIRSMSYRLHFIYLCKLIEKRTMERERRKKERERESLNQLNRSLWKPSSKVASIMKFQSTHFTDHTIHFFRPIQLQRQQIIKETTEQKQQPNHTKQEYYGYFVCCVFLACYFFSIRWVGSRVWLPSSWVVYIQMALW